MTRINGVSDFFFAGHLTTMSDVFSFGVVLLELMTGRKSVDKTRGGREKCLVEWARPLLKDAYKLDGIMDPRLEGQYSTEGARKAAALAYQCLSSHPKSRPAMRNVVKTLESLLDLTDIPIGPFVYIAPTEENNQPILQKIEEREVKQCEMEEKKEQNQVPRHKGPRQRQRRRVKPSRTRSVYSDTDLYKILGSSLYSPNH